MQANKKKSTVCKKLENDFLVATKSAGAKSPVGTTITVAQSMMEISMFN